MVQKAIDRFTYSRNGAGAADQRCLIRVNIPGVTTDAQHTRYKIDVMNVQTQQTWQTTHRYSEFLALRNELLAHFDQAERKCPGCVNFEKVIKLFEFPSKRYFTSSNPVVVNYRKTALRSFLSLLASHSFTSSPKCPTCSGAPFTAVRDFLTEEGAGTAASPTNSAGDGHDRESTSTIRESIQVKNFTTYIAPPKANVVNSEGVFIRQASTEPATSAKSKKSKPANTLKSQPQKKNAPKKAAPEPAVREVLPSPASSSSGNSKSTASLPPSPTRVAAEQARRDDDASFVSFSGGSEDTTQRPHTEQASPRRTSSKSKRNKNKRGASHETVQSQMSVKESEDDEFGSLNMDFLSRVSVAKE